MKTKHLLNAILLALPLTAAHAGELTLYTDDNFRGPSLSVREATPDLARLGFNDRASSAIVRSGTWELCEHANFAGRCIVLERGEYARLEGMNDVISSLREVDRHGRREEERSDRNDRNYGGDNGRRGEPIVLFAHAQFDGRRVELHGDSRSLTDFDFNDQAGSIVVNEGRWELCEHADFGGRCIVLGPGRYDHLDDMNNRISSVRRVR